MGFRRSDYLDPPNPVDFTDPITGVVNWRKLEEDLRGRLLTDHVGFGNGITTEELAAVYFKRTDFEACSAMGQAIQRARKRLMEAGIFVKNTNYRWHIADGALEKIDYIKNRTRGLVAAFRRTSAQLGIAANQHPEIAQHALVDAYKKAEGGLLALEKAERRPLPGGSSGAPSGGSDE